MGNIFINIQIVITIMNADKGYIYVRRPHISYNNDGVCKLGKTQDIPKRVTQYARVN
jgi:hypothetical protein